MRLVWRPDDIGGWFADGAAFDAAGADALWIDVTGQPELDPLALAAALAADCSLVRADHVGDGDVNHDRLIMTRPAVLPCTMAVE